MASSTKIPAKPEDETESRQMNNNTQSTASHDILTENIDEDLKNNQDSLSDFYTKKLIRVANSPYIPTHVSGLDDLLRGGILLPFNNSQNVANSDSKMNGTDKKDSEENLSSSNSSLVILIAGQPGTGKTTLATQIMLGIYHYIEHSRKLNYIDDIADNKQLTCTHTKVPLEKFKEDTITTRNLLGEMKNPEPVIFTCEQTYYEYSVFLQRFKDIVDIDDVDRLNWLILNQKLLNRGEVEKLRKFIEKAHPHSTYSTINVDDIYKLIDKISLPYIFEKDEEEKIVTLLKNVGTRTSISMIAKEKIKVIVDKILINYFIKDSEKEGVLKILSEENSKKDSNINQSDITELVNLINKISEPQYLVKNCSNEKHKNSYNSTSAVFFLHDEDFKDISNIIAKINHLQTLDDNDKNKVGIISSCASCLSKKDMEVLNNFLDVSKKNESSVYSVDVTEEEIRKIIKKVQQVNLFQSEDIEVLNNLIISCQNSKSIYLKKEEELNKFTEKLKRYRYFEKYRNFSEEDFNKFTINTLVKKEKLVNYDFNKFKSDIEKMLASFSNISMFNPKSKETEEQLNKFNAVIQNIISKYINYSYSDQDKETQFFNFMDDLKFDLEKIYSRNDHFRSNVDLLAKDKFIEKITKFYEDYCKRAMKKDSTKSYTVWKDELDKFLNEDKSNRVPVLVVDGLNSFTEKERRNLDTQKMIRQMRKKAVISIIVYEDDKDHYENIDYLADMIINLKGEEVAGSPKYYLNQMIIEKSRFQQSVLGLHQYKIRDVGFRVYPSLHFRTHRLDKLKEYSQLSFVSIAEGSTEQNRNNANSEQCVNFKSIHRPTCFSCAKYDPKAINKILKKDLPEEINQSFLPFLLKSKLKRGSSLAIMGPRHTFKLQSSLDFLRTGSIKGEAGLVISFMDSDEKLSKERSNLCNWICGEGKNVGDCRKCYLKVYTFQMRPGCITPEEFMCLLEDRLILGAKEKNPIRRILFWDIVHLENNFPFFTYDILFIPSLIDYLKYNWGISVVFVGPSNSSSKQSSITCSLASNVIFTWRDSFNEDFKKKYDCSNRDLHNNDLYAFYSSAVENDPSKSSYSFFFRDKKAYQREYWSENVNYDKYPKLPSIVDLNFSRLQKICEADSINNTVAQINKEVNIGTSKLDNSLLASILNAVMQNKFTNIDLRSLISENNFTEKSDKPNFAIFVEKFKEIQRIQKEINELVISKPQDNNLLKEKDDLKLRTELEILESLEIIMPHLNFTGDTRHIKDDLKSLYIEFQLRQTNPDNFINASEMRAKIWKLQGL